MSADRDEIIAAIEQVITWTRRMRPPQGLSATAFTTLDSLTLTGPVRVSVLAAREGVSQPGMTSLLNRLELDGLARRTADPRDRRAALVTITDAGRQRVRDYRRSRAGTLAERLDDLSPDDRARLRAALPALHHLVAEPAHSTQSAHSFERLGSAGQVDTSTAVVDTSTPSGETPNSEGERRIEESSSLR